MRQVQQTGRATQLENQLFLPTLPLPHGKLEVSRHRAGGPGNAADLPQNLITRALIMQTPPHIKIVGEIEEHTPGPQTHPTNAALVYPNNYTSKIV